MSTFLGSITANTIIQGLIGIIALVGTFILLFNKVDVPNFVILLDGAIIAFYFNTMTANNTAKAIINKLNGNTKELL